MRRSRTKLRHRTALNADLQKKPDRRQGKVDLLCSLSARGGAAPGGEQPERVLERVEMKDDPVILCFGACGPHAISLALLIGNPQLSD